LKDIRKDSLRLSEQNRECYSLYSILDELRDMKITEVELYNINLLFRSLKNNSNFSIPSALKQTE
ncbi:hypothetical protein CU098_008575, partial [Rhizopus stolonifer]